MKILLMILTVFFPFIAFAEDEAVKVKFQGKIEIRTIQEGMPYLTNRKYLIKKIPKFLQSKEITILPGGKYKPITARVPEQTELIIGLDSGRKMGSDNAVKNYVKKLKNQGWSDAGKIQVTGKRMKYFQLLKKRFKSSTEVTFEGVGFPGVVVIAPKISIVK